MTCADALRIGGSGIGSGNFHGIRKSEASPGLVMIAEGAMTRALRDRYSCMAGVVADLDRVARQLPLLGPHSPKAKEVEFCPDL